MMRRWAGAAAASTANVADAALTAGALTVPAATEGQAFSGQLATFTDADPNAAASDFTAMIDWGDGRTTAGTVAANTVWGRPSLP